jgi:hypothetical protein
MKRNGREIPMNAERLQKLLEMWEDCPSQFRSTLYSASLSWKHYPRILVNTNRRLFHRFCLGLRALCAWKGTTD